MRSRIFVFIGFLGIFALPLAFSQEKDCKSQSLTEHTLELGFTAYGCSVDSALADHLIAQAEKEREKKCPACSCDANTVCATYIRRQDFASIKARLLAPTPYRDADCPDKVGYLVEYLSSKESQKFQSGCACVSIRKK
ncbi:MAG TPA: hypothetical protein VK699_10225 [Terriglobales bacterium]|jgi:hypothetical protein|nr:hypothetical protein [Terriglobales bacterium]